MFRLQNQQAVPSTVPYDLAHKILHRIPPEYRQSFTPEQIEVLRLALVETRQRPTWKVSFGPVALSIATRRGPRSKHRSQQRQASLICLLVSLVGIGCVFGLLRFRYAYQISSSRAAVQLEDKSVHPTVLPFRKDRFNCEKNGAEWVNQECVDHGHDLTF